MARLFVRLKLRLIRNGLKGRRFQLVSLIAGLVFGADIAVIGFGLLADPPNGPGHLAIPVRAFFITFVGWFLVPLAGSGVDETLDPGRLMLLPLSRRDLMLGLLAASAVGIAPIATLVTLSGALVGYGRSWQGVLMVLIAVLLGFALCLAGARALTAAFSRLLRSRRARDVTAVVVPLLGGAVILLAQVPGLLVRGHRISPGMADRLARVIGWTPPGLLGRSVANAETGHLAVAAVELLPAALLLGMLVWWWAFNLERLSTTADSAAGAGRIRRRSQAIAWLVSGMARWMPLGERVRWL